MGKNVCVCAVDWPGEKKMKDLGCAVLYLSVFPCTHRNIEGYLYSKKCLRVFWGKQTIRSRLG